MRFEHAQISEVAAVRPPGKRLRRRAVARIVALAVVVLAVATVCPAQENISEVTVIRGGSSDIPPPSGYVKINKDLNTGAGGDYIYVCYKKGAGAPITGLYVTLNSGSPPSNPKYTKIDVDLNAGADGDFIYLWTTKDPDCAAVKDIIVQFGAGVTPPAGYTKIDVDLNRGARGEFIYLSYLKQ